MYVYTHTYVHTYIHTCVHACIHTYIHTYVRTCIDIQIQIYRYIHRHIYISTYIHVIHTFMYIPKQKARTLSDAGAIIPCRASPSRGCNKSCVNRMRAAASLGGRRGGAL